MTIRFPAGSGTEMKKRSLILLALAALLLFCSCGGSARFTVSADGYRFTDGKTGVVYTALSPAFEPAKGGTERGICKMPGGTELTLREIPSLSPETWLADDEKTLYFAGEGTPDPAAWTVTAVIFCEEDAISIERSRLTQEDNAEALSALVTLWFSGEATELSPTLPSLVRTAKLVFAEVPNIYYCITYYRYEDGSAVLSEKFSGRAVCVPEKTDALFEVK